MALRSMQTGMITPAGDARRGKRRELVLGVGASVEDFSSGKVLIHNLSTTGLLIETEARLIEGQELLVDLPHAGLTSAIVVWAGERLFGCKFAEAVSQAAVSAALLRAPIKASPPHREQIEEQQQPQGVRLPPHKSLWVIFGLAVFSWSAITAVAALLIV